MKYGIFIEQEGEGCDYTIGCGMRFDVFDAPDDAAAQAKAKEMLTSREDVEDDDPYLAGENDEQTFEKATLVKIVGELPIDEWRLELSDAADDERRAREDAAEEAELQRLLAKRRGRGAT